MFGFFFSLLNVSSALAMLFLGSKGNVAAQTPRGSHCRWGGIVVWSLESFAESPCVSSLLELGRDCFLWLPGGATWPVLATGLYAEGTHTGILTGSLRSARILFVNLAWHRQHLRWQLPHQPGTPSVPAYPSWTYSLKMKWLCYFKPLRFEGLFVTTV